MGAFEDYIASLKANGDNTEAHDTLYTELTNAHTSDLSVREAAIAEREARIAAIEKERNAKDAELTAQKARNWDLIRQSPASSENTHLSTDATDKPIDIDDLFERR